MSVILTCRFIALSLQLLDRCRNQQQHLCVERLLKVSVIYTGGGRCTEILRFHFKYFQLSFLFVYLSYQHRLMQRNIQTMLHENLTVVVDCQLHAYLIGCHGQSPLCLCVFDHLAQANAENYNAENYLRLLHENLEIVAESQLHAHLIGWHNQSIPFMLAVFGFLDKCGLPLLLKNMTLTPL